MATFRMVFGTDWGLCKLSVRGYFEKGNKKDKKKIGTALVPNFIIPKTLARTLYLSPKELAKAARKSFDWYPSEKDVRKIGLQDLVFSFIEAKQIANMFLIELELKNVEKDVLGKIKEESLKLPIDIQAKSCIISVLGHANHGKTSLLDAISGMQRENEEVGKITQRLVAIDVALDSDPYHRVTFIDSPGQEIFESLRDSAGSVADIILVVIGVNEGVLAQTDEVLSHVLQARIPTIFAFTKSDLDPTGEKLENLKNELESKYNFHFLDTSSQGVSRILLKSPMLKNRTGISSLPTWGISLSSKSKFNLDVLLSKFKELTTDLQLQGNKNDFASGIVIESMIESGGRGNIVEILIHHGTLRIGDWVVSGPCIGQVRGMRNQDNVDIVEATAGQIIQLMAFKENTPSVADSIRMIPSKELAHELVEQRQLKVQYDMQSRYARKKVNSKNLETDTNEKIQIESEIDVEENDSSEEIPNSLTVPVVLKAESVSALEVMTNYVASISKVGHSRKRLDSSSDHSFIEFSKRSSNDKFVDVTPTIEVVHSGIGQVNRTDIRIAGAIELVDKNGDIVKRTCPIYHFGKFPPHVNLLKVAKSRGIVIKHFDVMPNLLDDLCTVGNYYNKKL